MPSSVVISIHPICACQCAAGWAPRGDFGPEAVGAPSRVEEEQEAFTIDGDESVDAEAASAYVKEKARKEESEKALKRVFAACTDACSLTTAGIKLRETMEKNW